MVLCDIILLLKHRIRLEVVMKKPIKLGIVGLGRAGCGTHFKELADKKDMFEIAAVCDLLPDRTLHAREEYNCKTYSSIEDLLSDSDIEVVDIATRSCDHYDHARMALEAGKYVFLEKPMTETYEQAKKLLSLDESFGERRLFIRHNRRFESKFLQVREIIDSGLLGDVFYVKRAAGSFNYRNDWQTLRKYGGGQLLNWGPHLVDQALIFAGGDYTRMHSVIRQCVAKGDCEDDVRVSFLGVNGREVEIEISGADALRPPEYIVYGTRGALVDIDGNSFKIKYQPESYKAPDIVASEETPGVYSTTSDPNKKLPGGTSYGYRGTVEFCEEEREWEIKPLDQTFIRLYETVREGKDYPISSAEALKVMKTIEEIRRQNMKI